MYCNPRGTHPCNQPWQGWLHCPMPCLLLLDSSSFIISVSLSSHLLPTSNFSHWYTGSYTSVNEQFLAPASVIEVHLHSERTLSQNIQCVCVCVCVCVCACVCVCGCVHIKATRTNTLTSKYLGHKIKPFKLTFLSTVPQVTLNKLAKKWIRMKGWSLLFLYVDMGVKPDTVQADFSIISVKTVHQWCLRWR